MACDDRTDEADRTRAGQGQGRGSMEVSPVTAYGLGKPPLVFEVRRVMGSGVWHNFHWCCRGRKLFVSVQQNNNNTLHTNLNCKIEQDITNIVYNVIVLKKKYEKWKSTKKELKENHRNQHWIFLSLHNGTIEKHAKNVDLWQKLQVNFYWGIGFSYFSTKIHIIF